MKRRAGLTLWLFTVPFPVIAVLALLSCAGLGMREEAASPLTEAGKFLAPEAQSEPPAADSSSKAGAEKRAGAAEEGAEATWSEDTGSEAPGLAAAIPEAKAAPGGTVSARAARAPQASGLKAGFADDNKQFNYFLQFLATYASRVEHVPIPIEERIILKVKDSQGKSLANAEVSVHDEAGRLLCTGLTCADGSFLFFPSEHGDGQRYRVVVGYNQLERRLELDRSGRREVEVAFQFSRTPPLNVPLDLLFILDTTGSMGEEIQRLKTTIEIINLNLSSLSSRPRVRFGMVLYKDRGDEYVTRVIPLTEDLKSFQASLDRVEASGGGDTPEDLQAALRVAVQETAWSRTGIRLGFVITDAPPHLDYGQKYTYAEATREAKTKGIKIFTVGTGGLDLTGELVLRQLSQYTSGKYIFLTYGESAESEGGAPGSVSHHTGANYQTDKLEAIIIRFAKEELSHLTDQPIEAEEEYFTATRIAAEQREETLNKLFSMAISQLVDYSTFRIPRGSAAAVLPLSPALDRLAVNAEYFTEQLVLSFSREKGLRETFRIVERKDLQSILAELELQMSDLAQEQQASRVGELLGAELLITGKLYAKADGFELFLKLLRVETGEVLSVTKAVIDRKLGLEA